MRAYKPVYNRAFLDIFITSCNWSGNKIRFLYPAPVSLEVDLQLYLISIRSLQTADPLTPLMFHQFLTLQDLKS